MPSPGVSVRPWVVPSTVALAGSLLAFAIADRFGGPLLVSGPAGVVPVPIGAVVFGTVAGVTAAALLTRLARRARRARLLYLLLVGLGLLLSSVPPLQAATQPSTAAWLLVLHAVVAAALVPTGLRQLGERGSR